MNIQKIIRSVSVKEIKKARQKAKKHFEGGVSDSQMNMIAFD